MNFPEAFRAHVGPIIQRQITIGAIHVVTEYESFGEVRDRVYAFALSRGAAYLPVEVLLDLEDFIDTSLVKSITEAEARGADIDKAIRNDPIAYYDALANANPKLIACFAAINPAFRRYAYADWR